MKNYTYFKIIFIITLIAVISFLVINTNKKSVKKTIITDPYRQAIDFISDAANRFSLPDSELRTSHSSDWRVHGTFDWQTYKDPDFGFEFKYPQGLKILDGKGIYTTSNFSLPETLLEYSVTLYQPLVTQEDGIQINDLFNARIHLFYLYNSKKIFQPMPEQRMEKITINGTEFMHIYGFSIYENLTTHTYVSLIQPGWVFVIDSPFGTYSKNEDNIMLRAIVNTFKIPDDFSAQKEKNYNFVLPENKFDATMQLPNSNISFSYPKDGFYGLGIKTTKISSEGNTFGIHTESTAKFDPDKQSEYTTLDIKSFKKESKVQTLDDLISNSNIVYPSDHEYALKGKKVLIGNQEFFIYKGLNGITWWRGLAIIKNNVVDTTLNYWPTQNESPESIAAEQNNDKLFLEILENIKFE